MRLNHMDENSQRLGMQSTYLLFGVIFGLALGLLDIYFPSQYHNALYYTTVYLLIAVISASAAISARGSSVPILALGIASLSMGLWAIGWSLYYLLFRYGRWYLIFVIQRTINIGLGVYVPTSVYILSTFIQTAGGVLFIIVSHRRICDRVIGAIHHRLHH
jgi:hypothetical protein